MPAQSQQLKFIINTGTNTATSVIIPSAFPAQDSSSYFISLPERGAGYYSNGTGFHTVSYTVTPNFSGSISTQATLAINPTSADWFTVTNTTVTYPIPITPATTTTNTFNFVGNFVYVRGIVDRNPIQPNGTVMAFNYNY